jgi:transcription elongation factor GreA
MENYEILDIDKKAKKNNVITIGSRFTLKMGDEKNSPVQEYVLVGSTEADILENRISNESPLGQAVIGKTEGEMAEGIARAGKFTYKIMEIA